MKISKKHISGIIEWSIAIVLLLICYKYSFLSYGSFSPLKAHELSERTYHYGPSKIIKTIDIDKGKVYLCRYKDWFSADTVNKEIIKWYPGDGVSGTPIDSSKQVSYSWSGSGTKNNEMFMKVYGYVSDSKITTIQIEGDDKISVPKYQLDESRMFIFYWNEDNKQNKTKYLVGLDKDGKVIYKEELMGL
ncbi:hypothetical protein [Clostridium folliculivorans]|uniref:DUF5044 domain-containing protein n=1 Tax=Clostridium folliculivorans TaxID=2886038 RepID=A0A9W5XZZ5_9CLOT|nr:hypothetical protein [Clostridium folliculivorans]GKU24171.1 hypothetical protein CFOLD11_09970 [Clostridium folliculivorans]GKU30276.1 hypothetical protein CFB3_23830 [Clostridium folliculivorans]